MATSTPGLASNFNNNEQMDNKVHIRTHELKKISNFNRAKIQASPSPEPKDEKVSGDKVVRKLRIQK